MRLSDFEIEKISSIIRNHFGESSVITLFGSRVDESKKGGDIDLLVEAEYPPEDLFRKKLEALSDMQFALGERKIDLVTFDVSSRDEMPVIVRQAKEKGVKI